MSKLVEWGRSAASKVPYLRKVVKLPAEFYGATCSQCRKELPPCKDFERFGKEFINRGVDKVHVFNFLKGKYYRMNNDDIPGEYYCPDCFWEPKKKYDKMQQEEEELRLKELEAKKAALESQIRSTSNTGSTSLGKRQRSGSSTENSTTPSKKLKSEGHSDDYVCFIEAVKDVVNWYTLGLLLEIKKTKLDTITINFSTGGVERQRIEMIHQWLQKKPKTPWKKLCEALRKMDEVVIAERIELEHLQS